MDLNKYFPLNDKVVKEQVQVQTLPRRIAATLTFVQLRELCKDWWIETPANFEEDWTSAEIHDRYMNLLKDRLTD